MSQYVSLLLDPPWNERGGGKIKRGADKHYALMKATSNFLPDALWLMKAMGAQYVTNFTWVGQRSRQEHETLLFGRIDKVPVPETKDRRRSVIYAPVGEHSQKPEAQYDIIEAHDPPGKRVEFFARSPRDGWDTWGNEA